MSATGGKVALVSGRRPRLQRQRGAVLAAAQRAASSTSSATAATRELASRAAAAAPDARTTRRPTCARRGGCTDSNNNAADFASGRRPRATPPRAEPCSCGAADRAPAPPAPPPSPTGGHDAAHVAVTPGTEPAEHRPRGRRRPHRDRRRDGAALPRRRLQRRRDRRRRRLLLSADRRGRRRGHDDRCPPPSPTPTTARAPPLRAHGRRGPTGCAIHDIQGAAHRSPLAGAGRPTPGIVTAARTNGFYLQDPSPDADDATSEGIFVFTASRADGRGRRRGPRERHASASSAPAARRART